MRRKPGNPFYFSVEGETEKWYLEHLRDLVNGLSEARSRISLKCLVCKSPLEFIKRQPFVFRTEAGHICDYESGGEEHRKVFENVLAQMEEAERIKDVHYELGYSNFTFELWMILHKADCFGALNDRKDYLIPLNRAYNTRFQSLGEYKEERNFKALLRTITLGDVWRAVGRADRITARNGETQKAMRKGRFAYYRGNPALSVQNMVKKILESCGCAVAACDSKLLAKHLPQA